MRERRDPASYFLSSPVVFWLLAKLAELWPTEACLPSGKDRGIRGGNKRQRSAGADSAGRRPLEGRQGLDRQERTRTIRRTAAKKRRRHNGPGSSELCDVETGPNSRPRSGRPIISCSTL